MKMRDTYNALRRVLPALGIASALFAQRAVAHEPEPIEFSEIGIPYAWLIKIDDGESTHIDADHVGAWSWDEDSFPATAKGWTHTSKWVKLDLTKPAALTLTLESQAGVPWPSSSDPSRLAGTNLYPSFTLYRGWDTDAGLIVLTNGATLDQDHTFNNRGNIEWAEDVTCLDHLDNSTEHSATRTWLLPAGHYTINLGGNSPATLAEGRQGYLATLSTTPVPVAITNAALHDIAFNEVGIPYGIGLSMDDNASATTTPDHVGAWSWDEDSFPATAKGWTHTSKWVKLNLTKAARFTLVLESREGVPWPSSADPDRLAGTNLFPSFSIYRGWDTDAGVGTVDQDHTFNNRGNIAWAEDVTYLDHLDNSATHTATRSWMLPAGQYTINLGGNSPVTLAEGRQGYRATFTTAPVVVLPDTQASGIAYMTYDRAAWAKIAPSAAYTDISGNPTGATNSTADVDGRRWMFPDRIEGKTWAGARYPADYLTGLPTFPLPQPARGFALPVNSYGTNSFANRHKITSFNSSTNPTGYIGLAGSLRITSDFNEPGASVWWEHLAIQQDPADSVWKIFATSGAGQGSVFELVNVAMETVNGSLHFSADYIFGNTEWLQFLQGSNGDLDTNAILGHIELVPTEPATLVAGQATINYDKAAWDSLASGFSAPPVLTLSAFYNQAEANALEQSQLITNAQSGASYTGQVYAMNGATVTNLPTRYTQPTTFAYTPGNPAGHTGQIGLGGVARFAVLGGAGGNLLFGELTLQYDINRVALGGSGWYLFGNIPPAAAVFDLLNVTITETPGALTISGDMGVSFEVANFLFATPTDTLKDVGDFNFTGYKVPFTTPSIARVFRSGGNVVVHGANGVPGSTFALVSSADATAPVSSWSTVATGTFNVAGACSISVPINTSEPARFFRLRQP